MSAPRCEHCRRRNAVWVTGSGFGAHKGARVCDNWACRTWASGGYPVEFRAVKK